MSHYIDGTDVLGASADPPKVDETDIYIAYTVGHLIGGAIGSLLWQRHRILGFVAGALVIGSPVGVLGASLLVRGASK